MEYPPRKMTTEHLNWLMLIFATELPSNAKLLASYLNTFMNSKNHDAWPSISRMQSDCSLSRNTVCRMLKLLQEEGWISKKRQGGVLDGKNTPSKYTLNWPEKISKELAKSDEGVVSQDDYVVSQDDYPLVSQDDYVVSQDDPGSVTSEPKSEKESERKKKRVGTKRFVPPTREQVAEHMMKAKLDDVPPITLKEADAWADDFVDYYTSNGWKVGSNKMACWKSASTKWAKKNARDRRRYETRQQSGQVGKYAGIDSTLNNKYF